ncbi:methyltransferase domain-containing protein [Paenibacillus lemnae]|uniref:Methyltransferase domain-containing protein n=1 Tax=Paenibacillus lemnae TaxID=1330551 RepID=A0A848M9L8_PAELE|nr:methyltransferase domain-containing protein [Paenibacillus lemnae]
MVFVNGEASRLPFDDDSFDFVYTRLMLMHNQDPESIIKEMNRVCRPGGSIVSVEIDDETMVFYPYAKELSVLIRAYIEYAEAKGTDRIMGRKLYGLYKSVGIEETKVIIQTSDYEGPYDDIPFSLKLAMGSDEGRHLVEAQLITEEQRIKSMHAIQQFCADPDRFYSGSFMYCVGRKRA